MSDIVHRDRNGATLAYERESAGEIKLFDAKYTLLARYDKSLDNTYVNGAKYSSGNCLSRFIPR